MNTNGSPLPLYLDGVGFHDHYRPVLSSARHLASTDADVLTRFISIRPLRGEGCRSSGLHFDHPVNKRPNYHFGQWDPHRIDGRGRYRRFVLQEVTLDAVFQRTQDQQELPPEEVLFEAGAVLAGTMLMASAVSGNGPDAHDSSVTLSTLLPRIVRCREDFYNRLLSKVPGPHGDRLRAESEPSVSRSAAR
jgi:hypothetical protein